MKRLFLLLLILPWLSVLHAQEITGMNEAIAALKGIAENAKNTPIGFDMKYIYTNESKSSVILDSLYGSIEVSGNNMYCRMDGTEAIRNDKYSILVFKADKLLMIGPAKKDSAIDPLLNMQSIIVKSGATNCSITRKGAVKTINIVFTPDALCKQMKMIVDTAKGQLLSIEYLVKSTMLVDPEAQADNQLPEGYDEYALVRSTYYNYHNLKQSDARFKEEQYFYKEGNEYKPATAYSNFQVVLAAPNL